MINLERQGDYLFLDQKLALLIPSGATFEPETDETYAALKEIPFAMTEDGEAKTLDLLLYKVKSSDMANQILATTMKRTLIFSDNDDISSGVIKTVHLTENELYEVALVATRLTKSLLFWRINALNLDFLIHMENDEEIYQLSMTGIVHDMQEFTQLKKCALEIIQSIEMIPRHTRLLLSDIPENFGKRRE